MVKKLILILCIANVSTVFAQGLLQEKLEESRPKSCKSDELVEVYKGFGINLEESQGNKKNQLPIAATIVISKDRVVKYFFGDVDYKKRAEPTKVLKIVKGL